MPIIFLTWGTVVWTTLCWGNETTAYWDGTALVTAGNLTVAEKYVIVKYSANLD